MNEEIRNLLELVHIEFLSFANVGYVDPIRDAVGGIGPGDDVFLAYLLGPPPKGRHPVLDGPRRALLGKPALDKLLDVLGLQAMGIHMPESHLLELVGD